MNFSAGCQTGVSNIVMAITVVLFLKLFSRLLYYTPVAILASVILSALPGLINIHEACYIWKVDKLDFLACIGAFLGILFASVEVGLLVAVSHSPLSNSISHLSSLVLTFFLYIKKINYIHPSKIDYWTFLFLTHMSLRFSLCLSTYYKQTLKKSKKHILKHLIFSHFHTFYKGYPN